MSSKKKILIIAGIVILIIIAIAFFSSRQAAAPPPIVPTPTPARHLKDFEHIDSTSNSVPDIRQERLPDGSTIHYGSNDGPLTPEREKELRKIIDEEIKKPQSDASSNLFSVFPLRMKTYAANIEDTFPIDMGTARSEWELIIRNLFRAHAMYWTQKDLGNLTKIKMLADRSIIGGALGAWDYVLRTNPDGSFQDIKGLMWIWQDGPVEEAVIHEYGHHYTNYWAAQRTAGAWATTNRWPVDSAGDYYALRPLPDNCYCTSFDIDPVTKLPVCPYENRLWEILAEDYRATATIFNTGHIFANASCLTGGGIVGQPDLIKTAAYLAALPLNSGASLPTNDYCLDSDRGNDHGVEGTLLTNAAGWPATNVDRCAVQQSPGNYAYQQSCSAPNCFVEEYYCNNTTPVKEIPYAACAGGCQNGACLGTGGTPLPTITAPPPSPVPSNFPRTPFESCYNKGGVCTQLAACMKFRGTVFQKDTTVCPISEGCCVFPHPQAIAPTQTPCETEGGICTNSVISCTAGGGAVDSTKGCSTQCCKFSTLSKTYTNQDYNQIILRVKNGAMSPLAISAWIENACRTPGLQAVTCDPKISGDCERLTCVR